MNKCLLAVLILPLTFGVESFGTTGSVCESVFSRASNSNFNFEAELAESMLIVRQGIDGEVAYSKIWKFLENAVQSGKFENQRHDVLSSLRIVYKHSVFIVVTDEAIYNYNVRALEGVSRVNRLMKLLPEIEREHLLNVITGQWTKPYEYYKNERAYNWYNPSTVDPIEFAARERKTVEWMVAMEYLTVRNQISRSEFEIRYPRSEISSYPPHVIKFNDP